MPDAQTTIYDFPMPDANKQAFGEWLKAIRATAGLTQKQLAAAVGTDGPHVIAWEKGRNVPGGMKLVAIMRACGVRIVAATEPPLPVADQPATAAELVGAVEALTRQMAALAEAAARLDPTEGGAEALPQEEASG